MLLQLSADDLPRVCAWETRPEFRGLVGSWSMEQHASALADPDVAYRLIADADGRPAGFVILRGLASPHTGIEVKRLVVGEPGRGLGRAALMAVMALVFDEWRRHRLWLDVLAGNARARHLYGDLGFREDGVLRECFLLDGERHDLMLMSMLEREYRAR